MTPDGTRYAASLDSSGNASVTLPTNKILSLYIEETYTGYTNAMLLSYPDGGVTFRNGPSATGATDAIVLGTPTVTTDGRCVAPVQPDSNISTSGSGLPDAAVYTNIDSMNRYGSGVLDIYPVLDANQDGIPDAYEYGAGLLPKPAADSSGNIGVYSSTNTNSPAVVLALTVDPNTAVYTDAPVWTNAQVSFALDPVFTNWKTNYLDTWSNDVVSVTLQPGFASQVPSNLTYQWSNAAAAVVTAPAFTNLVPAALTTQLTTLQTAVTNNALWASQSNNFNNTNTGSETVVIYLALSPMATLSGTGNSPKITGDLSGATINGGSVGYWTTNGINDYLTSISNVIIDPFGTGANVSCSLWSVTLNVPIQPASNNLMQFKFLNGTPGSGSDWGHQEECWSNSNTYFVLVPNPNRTYVLSRAPVTDVLWLTNFQSNINYPSVPFNNTGVVETWCSTNPTGSASSSSTAASASAASSSSASSASSSVSSSGTLSFTLNSDQASYTVFGTNLLTGNVIIPATYLGYPVTSIGCEAFAGCNGITNIVIPDSITDIGIEAFVDCMGLTSVAIPASVVTMEICPFMECFNLTNISVDSSNQYFASSAGVLFDKAMSTVIEYPCGNSGNYSIPAGVSAIGTFAFEESHLTGLNIPVSVASIGVSAFYASALQTLVIPSSVNSIGSSAFDDASLTNIIINATNPPTADNTIFLNDSALSNISVPSGSVGSYQTDWQSYSNLIVSQ